MIGKGLHHIWQDEKNSTVNYVNLVSPRTLPMREDDAASMGWVPSVGALLHILCSRTVLLLEFCVSPVDNEDSRIFIKKIMKHQI